MAHAYYEEDARVRRQAETLVGQGWEVVVLGLRRPTDTPSAAIAGVDLRRLDVRRHQGAGIGTYLVEYLAFFARAAVASVAAHRQRRFSVAQVASLPDFLVLALLPLRLAGVPLVLDLHEAMPEFFRARFPRAAGRLPLAALRFQERLSCRAATAVLTVNDALGERLLRLGLPRDKLLVVHNSPDPQRFDPAAQPSRAFMADGVLRLVYAGALTPTYELDVIVDAVARLVELRPELAVDLAIYGRGDSEAPLRARIEGLGLDGKVHLQGRIPLEDVPAAIAAADVGLAPTRRDPFTDLSLSAKVLEYAAMGRLVVASRLPTAGRYFPAHTLATYEPGSAADLAAVLLRLVDGPEERAARLAATATALEGLAWEHEAGRYVALLDRLAGGRRGVRYRVAASSGRRLAPRKGRLPPRKD
ncbi:MAG TPA: glycosyltransferase [Candidatus Limnocylindrales bacterium]|nr:glycosyltransferase [Candidatus Limnocylindrales bacterium]